METASPGIRNNLPVRGSRHPFGSCILAWHSVFHSPAPAHRRVEILSPAPKAAGAPVISASAVAAGPGPQSTPGPQALRVLAASAEHLLAMKVLAARRRDADDIRFLIKELDLGSAEEILALCAEVFPDEEVPERARMIVEDAVADM